MIDALVWMSNAVWCLWPVFLAGYLAMALLTALYLGVLSALEFFDVDRKTFRIGRTAALTYKALGWPSLLPALVAKTVRWRRGR